MSDFWSYFFPFEKVAAEFEFILDAWVSGRARVIVTGRSGRVLQVWVGGRWKSVYMANRILPYWGKPKRVIQNRPLPDDTAASGP